MPDVKLGLPLVPGPLAASVVVELPLLLVVLDEDEGVGVAVAVGMSDAGTAEIGPPAWAPVGGLYGAPRRSKAWWKGMRENARAECQLVVAIQRRAACPKCRARALVECVCIGVRAAVLCISMICLNLGSLREKARAGE